jgi:exosortase A-associated hydrolase 1
VTIAERALTFECEGETLVGVVSDTPSAGTTGVLVVVGGPQYRVGCHRQFVLLARRLAESGIPAMRFDYRGMGDSAGNARTFLETSRDIEAALDAFQRACPGVERVVLWGLCDAASASLLYWEATSDTRIGGFVLLNPWIASDEAFAQAQIASSFQRILDGDFWSKLLRGGINVGGAARSFVRAVARVAARPAREHDVERSFTARMADALERFRGPVLIVLSGSDLVSEHFRAHCAADARWRGMIGRSNIEQAVLANADHTFSIAADRVQVESLIVDWVHRSFSSPARAPAVAAAAAS